MLIYNGLYSAHTAVMMMNEEERKLCARNVMWLKNKEVTEASRGFCLLYFTGEKSI